MLYIWTIKISSQVSVIALVLSVISLFAAVIPSDSNFAIIKYVFAVIACVFSIYGLIKIIRSMYVRKAYCRVQVALEEYKRRLENGETQK